MDRFLLVLCSVFLAIGMVSLVFPDGVAAIGVVVLVSTLALLVFRQFTSEREFLTNLFIAALLLRILFGVMIHVLDMRDYFGGRYFGDLGSIGVVPRTPRMSSSILAPASSCASPRFGATTCNPTGRPEAVNPQGSDSAGQHTSVMA